jgi:hypothetical protein
LTVFFEINRKVQQVVLLAVPYLRLIVAGYSRRRPGFASRAVPVEFVVEKVALGQVFLRVLRFSSVNIIPPLLYALIYHVGGIQGGRF